jgi:predicted metal-dependent enzyme (double-stranded beta helix superfamily)
MVADFMSRAREMLAGGVNHETLNAVGRLLAEVSREPGFVPETRMKSLHGGNTTSAILQSDPDGLTLMVGRFSAKEETPVHDHNSWGIACVVSGVDRYRHWEMGQDGRVRILYEKDLGPGEFVTWLDPPRDIHSQKGVGEDALELVLFGKNVMTIPRNYYNPETGEVRSALPQ